MEREIEAEPRHDRKIASAVSGVSAAETTMMDITSAQRDMSKAYVAGAPGVFVSGVVWLIAGVLRTAFSAEIAFAGLFIGGMLIVPASLLIARLVFGAPKAVEDNPLQRLGFESTIGLFAGILLAYVLLDAAPALAFPTLALAIGARYFAFRSIYGDPLYWALGGSIIVAATLALLGLAILDPVLLFTVGVMECVFAVLLLARKTRRLS